MERLNVKFTDELSMLIYKGGEELRYQTDGSSGLDLRACAVITPENSDRMLISEEGFILLAGKRAMICAGIHTAFAEDWEIQVRSRSGLAWKSGIFVLNSPGTIDSDYRGEIRVILQNMSDKDFVVKKGDRIAQMVLCSVKKATVEVVSDLDNTTRGSGGFGSTGVNN